MVEMPDEVYEALTDFYTLKMVASVNSSGMPNAVMVATTSALDKSTVCMADLRLGKTKSNILETKKFTVNVLKLTLESYQIKCSFNSYQDME